MVEPAMTKRNADAEAAPQYLIWALEHIEKVGNQKAAHYAHLASETLKATSVQPAVAAKHSAASVHRMTRQAFACFRRGAGVGFAVVAVQRSHEPDPRQHLRAVVLGDEQQRLYRGLPFGRVVIRLGQLGNVRASRYRLGHSISGDVRFRGQTGPAVQAVLLPLVTQNGHCASSRSVYSDSPFVEGKHGSSPCIRSCRLLLSST